MRPWANSAGFAVYGAATPGAIKLTIRGPQGSDPETIVRRLKAAGVAVSHAEHDTHLVLTMPHADEAAARAEIAAMPELTVVGAGRRMEIFKEVGRPDQVAKRFGLETMAGTHAIGHTRMATKSAVTTDGAHPFTTGADQCLVHNGSLSNHNALRRELIREGLSFHTENDTEVAAGYMSWRMREGDSLEQTLHSSLSALDGFYTFVVGTEIRVRGAPRSDRLQAGRHGGNQTAGWLSAPSIGPWWICPASMLPKYGSPSPPRAYLWERALMRTVDLSQTSLRELNATLHQPSGGTNETHWRAAQSRADSMRSLPGLGVPITVEIEGHAGYYCGGMNKSDHHPQWQRRAGRRGKLMSGRARERRRLPGRGRDRLRRPARD